VIVQVPTARIVTVEPATLQTEVVVEVKVTGRPELAVAVTEKGGVPMVTLLRGPKAIVCNNGPTAAVSVALDRVAPAVVAALSQTVFETDVGALADTLTVAVMVL
jgi:hypothetical protein